MYRLKTCAAVLLLILLSACSGAGDRSPLNDESRAQLNQQVPVSGPVVPTERGDVLPESEASAPASITPVSEEFARRMQMPDTSILDNLEMPADDILGRLPSAVGTDSLNGSQHFKIQKASNVGTAKRLNSTGDTAWVMYRFQGYNFHKDPGTLRIFTANESFSGSNAGYVVAIANYATGLWQMLGSTQVKDQYIRSLVMSDNYRSPNQNVFIAVILPETQSMDVTKVELDFNEVTWLNVEVDSLAGWTPAVEFLPNGNIFLAYADFNTRIPLAAVLARDLDPGVPGNWVAGEMNSNGKGVGLGQDIVIGPQGTPRVSLAYTAIGGSGPNTLMGYTAYYNAGADNEAGFWNYEFGTPDLGIQELAGSSSTAYNSQSQTYGYATHFYNYSNSADNGSCRYRQFTLNETDPQEQIFPAGGLTSGGYWFPRIAFAPGDPLLYFANNGGFLTYESAPNTLNDIYVDESSHDIGSLAINPQASATEELFGFLYKHFDPDGDPNGSELLRYVPLLENLNLKSGGIQQIENLSPNSADYLADFNQVAFTSDGRPAIAYTLDNGGSITIRYAYWDGAMWVKEQVSQQAITKYTTNLRIWLDFAFDDNDIAGVCWDSPTADDESRLMFAIRGS
ncbi:hypothetical protein KDL29_13950 [bacterium]|nr:hypothetical protein [bacterium]